MDRLIRVATRGVMESLGLDPYQSQTQYLEDFLRGIAYWQQSGNMLPPCCRFLISYLIPELWVTMLGTPYQSSLIPYEEEIVALRHRRPPVSYARIAELLRQRYNLTICRETIFKFVKVRSRGRKVYSFSRRASEKKPTPATKKLSDSGLRPPITPAATTEPKPRRTRFQFMPSDLYSLTRMSPEEAAVIRKKLEEEGH